MEHNDKNQGNLQLFIVFLLSFIFIILIYLSVSNSNIKQEYKFLDTINVNSLNNITNINLGTLNIINNGFLTSRVKVKDLVLCSDILDKRTIKLNYLGEKVNVNYNNFDYYTSYIDVGVNDEKILNLRLNYIDKYYLRNKFKNLNSTNIKFKSTGFIYEVKNRNDIYNYCNFAKEQDLIKKISFNFNLKKTDLDTYFKNGYPGINS